MSDGRVLYDQVQRIVKRLMGTQDDFQMVIEEELAIEVTPEIGRRVDAIMAPCKDCEGWTPVGELKNDYCFGCHPGEGAE